MSLDKWRRIANALDDVWNAVNTPAPDAADEYDQFRVLLDAADAHLDGKLRFAERKAGAVSVGETTPE